MIFPMSLEVRFGKRVECPGLCGNLLLNENQKLKWAKKVDKNGHCSGEKKLFCKKCRQEIYAQIMFNPNALGHYKIEIKKMGTQKMRPIQNVINGVKRFCRI